MHLDPSRFHEASQYAATLPKGLASFPACAVRDIAIEALTRDFGRLAEEPGLPTEVANVLRGRLGASWVPEVTFQVAELVVRDLGFEDDASYFAWISKTNDELFDKPVLRSLMRLLSPTLVVLGATRRWATFHQGSELSTGPVGRQGDRGATVAHLRYPEGLFSRIFLLGLEQAFMAALNASRAKEPEVKLGAADVTHAEYRVSWRV